MLQRPWREPKTEEFAELTSFDDPKLAIERLAKRATMHWDKRDSVKEGYVFTSLVSLSEPPTLTELVAPFRETLTNFM